MRQLTEAGARQRRPRRGAGGGQGALSLEAEGEVGGVRDELRDGCGVVEEAGGDVGAGGTDSREEAGAADEREHAAEQHARNALALGHAVGGGRCPVRRVGALAVDARQRPRAERLSGRLHLEAVCNQRSGIHTFEVSAAAMVGGSVSGAALGTNLTDASGKPLPPALNSNVLQHLAYALVFLEEALDLNPTIISLPRMNRICPVATP